MLSNACISPVERAFRKLPRVSKSSSSMLAEPVSGPLGASDRQSSRRASHYVLRAGFIFISEWCLGASDTDGPHLNAGEAVATLMHTPTMSAIYRGICESSLGKARASLCQTWCILLLLHRDRRVGFVKLCLRDVTSCWCDVYTDFPSPRVDRKTHKPCTK
jgi:hypothetical protein